MNSAATAKLLAVSVTTATMMIASAIVVTAFLSSSTMPIQKASAQMQPPVGRMGPGMMGMGNRNDDDGCSKCYRLCSSISCNI